MKTKYQTRIKIGLSCLFAVGLLVTGGCRDSDKPRPGSKTPEQIVKDLEKKGKIPNLDRSTDLAGPDRDGNGVRDDIDTYISKLKVTKAQKKAFTQNAKSIQATILVDLNDDAAVRKVSRDMGDALNCTVLRFREDTTDKRYNINRSIERLTINTKERAVQYDKYNSARSGSVMRLATGDTCHE